MKTIIVTGSAGFIGFSLCIKLLERGDSIIGVDNHNDYYDPKIKEARLEKLLKYPNYKHCRVDISNEKNLEDVF
jgi:UDP-glucuronate 4-epimerase